jgi:GNAT superfamily N-acetyltransferase
MRSEMKTLTLSVNKETLATYGRIPQRFRVESKLEVELLDNGFGGVIFREQPVANPYIKDYGEPEETIKWPEEFDTSNWWMFLVQEKQQPIAGLTIACKTKGLWMLAQRDDLTCVWDIRVNSDYQHRGIGTELFKKAVKWSRDNGFKQLCVETQNNNVRACRFYLKQGCRLGAIHRYAYVVYPPLADETQLIWYLNL